MAESMVLVAMAGVSAAVVMGWYLWRVTAGHGRGGVTRSGVTRWPVWRPAIKRPSPHVERMRAPHWPSTGSSMRAADRFLVNPPPSRRYAERRAGRLADRRPTGPGSDRIGLNRADRRYSADRKETRDDGWRLCSLKLPGLRALVVRTLIAASPCRHSECHRTAGGLTFPPAVPPAVPPAASLAARREVSRGGVEAADAEPGGPGGGAAAGSSNVVNDDLRLAIRAVLVHTPQHWPSGVYCSNDRSPFPCRMRHWGEQVLRSAGWDQENISSLDRRAEMRVPPWLSGTGETIPPAS